MIDEGYENRCTVPYDNIEPVMLPLTKARCLCINGASTSVGSVGVGTVHQALRFRRCRAITASSRLQHGGAGGVAGEVTVSEGDP